LRWKNRRAEGRPLRYPGNKVPIEGVDAVALIIRKQHALVKNVRNDQGIPALDVVFQKKFTHGVPNFRIIAACVKNPNVLPPNRPCGSTVRLK
jgi:hypothetical protein